MTSLSSSVIALSLLSPAFSKRPPKRGVQFAALALASNARQAAPSNDIQSAPCDTARMPTARDPEIGKRRETKGNNTALKESWSCRSQAGRAQRVVAGRGSCAGRDGNTRRLRSPLTQSARVFFNTDPAKLACVALMPATKLIECVERKKGAKAR